MRHYRMIENLKKFNKIKVLRESSFQRIVCFSRQCVCFYLTACYARRIGLITAFNGRWSDAMLVSLLRMHEISTSDPGGETHMRSRANTGKPVGNVLTNAVFPNRV